MAAKPPQACQVSFSYQLTIKSKQNDPFESRQKMVKNATFIGPCPETSLVHRQSLSLNLNCIGDFQRLGIDYVVTKGSEYEFWQEGVYHSKEDIFRCFAYKTYNDGSFVKLAQGIGSDCNGMLSSELNFDNSAFRQLSLTRADNQVSNQCQFPDWVSQQTWKVIPRGGLRTTATQDEQNSGPRQVSFPKKNAFILGPEVSSFT